MKIRKGFVSNSSSSSFVVIDTSKGFISPSALKNPTLVVDGNLGETEFGWGADVLYDYGSRIIFAYLQTTYAKNPEWLEMLEDVIKGNSKVKEIIWNVTETYDSPDGKTWAYIDHQSSAAEGMNTEIFDDADKLKDFIFGKDSKIVLDNDNG
jgi:hypothetical protein